MFNLFKLIDVSEHALWKEQIKHRMALKEINMKVWKEINLFSPVWWFMLIVFILTWYIWWKLVDKTRLLEIVAYGLMVSVLASLFDIIATQNIIWGYPIRLTPMTPPVVFSDLCVLPVIFMLVYQYFSSWKSFSIAMVITSLFISFVLEPFGVWIDLIQFNNWEYFYSVPVNIFIGLFLKWVMNVVKTKQAKALSIIHHKK